MTSIRVANRIEPKLVSNIPINFEEEVDKDNIPISLPYSNKNVINYQTEPTNSQYHYTNWGKLVNNFEAIIKEKINFL